MVFKSRMGKFYSRLSYSFGNEDWETEHKALQIKAEDTVLCVTASGDRPLNLMTKELKAIVAVDANPLQNALFDLKKVALSKLPFSDYLAFIGVTPSTNRVHTFSQLAKDLDPMGHAFWMILHKKIERGVLYEGSVEKLLKVASSVLRVVRGKKIEKLFSLDDLEQQQHFVSQHWQTYLWKKTFQIGLHPWITRNFIKDPGLYEYVDPNVHVGNQIYERLHNYLKRRLAKDSILLSLIFKGKVEDGQLPPYLTEAGVKQIQAQSHKASFHTDDLITYFAKTRANTFDCFSISDVVSYLSKEQVVALLEGILRCAKPGARFCMRQLLSNHQIPTHLKPHFQRNPALEKELNDEDRCFVYNFTTGTIAK